MTNREPFYLPARPLPLPKAGDQYRSALTGAVWQVSAVTRHPTRVTHIIHLQRGTHTRQVSPKELQLIVRYHGQDVRRWQPLTPDMTNAAT